jgi:hypothetical protein
VLDSRQEDRQSVVQLTVAGFNRISSSPKFIVNETAVPKYFNFAAFLKDLLFNLVYLYKFSAIIQNAKKV